MVSCEDFVCFVAIAKLDETFHSYNRTGERYLEAKGKIAFPREGLEERKETDQETPKSLPRLEEGQT